jgi:hypothetical protein
MKNLIYFLICVVSFAFTTCIGDGYEEKNNKPENDKPYTKDSIEKTWKQIDDFVESDVGISDVRPLPDVMSEKESLVRAYSLLSKRGYFSPDNYMFSNAPILLTAKAARPLTIYSFDNDGWAGIYFILYAIAENGEVLIDLSMSAAATLSDDKLWGGNHSGYGHDEGYLARHYITETELIELVERQFDKPPDARPIIVEINLAGVKHSNSTPFWYFTVDDVEYIFALMVFNWNSVIAAGGLGNHAAISGDNGDWTIGWHRMARLDTRADFYKVIDENQNTAMVDNLFPYTPPAEAFEWTPIPLK